LADIAKQVKPKRLLLYHQLRWGASDREPVKEITDRYNGHVISAKDLDVYK
jgi:ribonuclease BN (tRNA processing enzyme)